jgi:hypothetical protein
MQAERRGTKRFQMSCPMTITARRRVRTPWSGKGQLFDIAVSGARFFLWAPLVVGTRVLLDVHFMNAEQRTTTVRFDGIVTRAQQEPPYETAVQFQTRGQFLRDGLRNTEPPKVKEAMWPNTRHGSGHPNSANLPLREEVAGEIP